MTILLVWNVSVQGRDSSSLWTSKIAALGCLTQWGLSVGVRGEFLRGMYLGFQNWLLSWVAPAHCPAQGALPGFICSTCCTTLGLLLCDSRLHLDTLVKPLPNALPTPAAETPIEEFTPTPAFPALQYLESVDVEGVAWRAGLRTGDFLIEVRLILTRASRWVLTSEP